MKVKNCRVSDIDWKLQLSRCLKENPTIKTLGKFAVFMSIRLFKYLWIKWLGIERNNLKGNLWGWSNGNENKMLII